MTIAMLLLDGQTWNRSSTKNSEKIRNFNGMSSSLARIHHRARVDTVGFVNVTKTEIENIAKMLTPESWPRLVRAAQLVYIN